MRLLCRYAGGLACLVTALALVACGGGPGSQPEPKQIENIAFSQGEKARTISLSDKFNGSDLTYSATTSNVRVATVTVDNDADTLTVTAVGPGRRSHHGHRQELSGRGQTGLHRHRAQAAGTGTRPGTGGVSGLYVRPGPDHPHDPS